MIYYYKAKTISPDIHEQGMETNAINKKKGRKGGLTSSWLIITQR